ncbi:MAG TPA: hypothetical protein VNI83_05675, partial [Vicinamibacterales bacterium]|nr:hypothetical protein [Vicinamibacterales bacterium]
MKISLCLVTSTFMLLLSTGAVSAQQPTAQQPAAQQPSAPPAAEAASRPATPTVAGDTGLWWVPTAEVLPHGRVAV